MEVKIKGFLINSQPFRTNNSGLQLSMALQNGVFYSASRLDAIYFDLSPNLSPKRREALMLTYSPSLQGKGLGVRSVLKLRSTIVAGYSITLSIIET